MKKIIFAALIAALTAVSCQKDESATATSSQTSQTTICVATDSDNFLTKSSTATTYIAEFYYDSSCSIAANVFDGSNRMESTTGVFSANLEAGIVYYTLFWADNTPDLWLSEYQSESLMEAIYNYGSTINEAWSSSSMITTDGTGAAIEVLLPRATAQYVFEPTEKVANDITISVNYKNPSYYDVRNSYAGGSNYTTTEIIQLTDDGDYSRVNIFASNLYSSFEVITITVSNGEQTKTSVIQDVPVQGGYRYTFSGDFNIDSDSTSTSSSTITLLTDSNWTEYGSDDSKDDGYVDSDGDGVYDDNDNYNTTDSTYVTTK